VSLGDGWYSREGDSQFGYVRWATDEARLLVDRSAATGLSRDAVLVLDVEPNAYQSGSWVEIEVLDGGRLLARRRLRQRTRFGVPLADDVDRHEIALKVVDISEGGRKALPLFERRDGLRYRLRAAGVSIVPQLSTRLSEFDPGSWGRANESRGLSVDRIREGVEVTIQGPNSAYCVRQGPFQVKAAGRHYFVLEYSSLEGGLDFSVLDNSYDRWCPSETLEIQQDDRRTVVLSCELVSGQSISLYVSNHLAPGETASRFILRRLRSSAAPRELTPTPSLYALIHAARGRVHNMLRTWRTRVNRGLNHVITLTRRVRTRLGGTETESREVVDLRAQLAESAAFNELAGLGRFLKEHRPSHLHQNGCGDFQLMAREHWFTLRGYPEFTMFSMNIDGLFSSAAHSAGIQERMLDMPRCIYHLEHERGSGWTPEGEAALRSRIAESGVGWLENETVHIMSAYMEWLGRPMIFNDLTWGFGETVLAEATFMPAGID
jgi:hypothetical protein